MKPQVRQKLAREPFAEKIRKLAQLIRLAKAFFPPAANRRDSLSRQVTVSQNSTCESWLRFILRASASPRFIPVWPTRFVWVRHIVEPLPSRFAWRFV